MTKKISILLLALLMSVSGWADVTYHILTLPISTTSASGKLHDWNFNATTYTATNYRYEALVCTSTSTTVGLPDEFKSPLLLDAAYKYYSASKITKTSQATVYANNTTKLDLYQINQTTPGTDDDADLAVGDPVGSNTDIYVVYSYDGTSTTCTAKGVDLKLDGTVKYNIQLSKDRFLAYNRTRQNRICAPKDNTVSGDYTFDRDSYFTRCKQFIFKNEIVKWTTNQDVVEGSDLYFHFKLRGGDPYHITIQNGYESGGWTYIQNNLMKKPDDGILYGKISTNMWIQNEDHLTYKSKTEISTDPVPGRFKDNAEGAKVQPVVSAFALLNHSVVGAAPAQWQSFANDGGEYVFVASKMNYNGQTNQPTAEGKYYYLQPNGGTNPQIKLPDANATLAYNSTMVKIGTTEKYAYQIVTPFGHVVSDTLYMSSIFGDDDPMTCIPEELKRKYVTFTGAYTDAGRTTPGSKFADFPKNGAGVRIVYLKYETDMPFETAAASATYDDLKWYNFYTNREPQYVVWLEGGLFRTNKNYSCITQDSHFAFVGDPFEMKIVSRSASNAAGALRYLTYASTFTDNMTYDGTGTAWEMLYDDNTGNYAGCFRLKQYQTDGHYFGWHYGNTDQGYPLRGSATDAARLTVIDIPTKTYVYHIMRNAAGDIAAKATVTQEVSAKLDFAHIPEIIRSPFVGFPGATLSFYATEGNAKDSESAITYAPEGSATQDIYVRYSISGINEEPYKSYKDYIDGAHAVNVRLNGEYIYYDKTNDAILSKPSITDQEADSADFLWYNGGSDPYAMTVRNKKAGKYVTASASNNSVLGWGAAAASAAKFIIKSTRTPSVYEVMYATGDGVDASTTYYNIGRDATNGTRIFQNTTYAHDYEQLRLQLTLSTATNVTYHLIDKAGTDLIRVVARQTTTEAPVFPSDYWSPLVAQYYYYVASNFTVTDGKYTLKSAQTELATVGSNTDIYVTYDTGDDYDLRNKKIMYLLKYEMGDTFNQENGSDGLNDIAQKAIYPYCNGDCNFFVYGQEQFDIQQQSAASTRTRWAWFLESPNNDPYHVRICSRQTETYNGDQARAYFHTYKPTGHDQIVTGLTWPGVSGIAGTEYMVLGSVGQFRLVTTESVPLDLNDDGDTDDEGESNTRRTVTSFEQYWKTWDTIRKKVLGDSGAKESQTDPNTVPATPATAVATKAGKDNRTYLTDIKNWHSYEQWAYAKRWNGYNISGAKSKGWESIEHWFQTVPMGEGYFDLVPITIDPALILLDQHGWEIMRKPLPNSADDPTLEAKHAALRVYDSPMVKEYHFWTKASKRSGFHQYYNLSQRISIDGENYSSSSIGTLPPIDATYVKDAKGNVLDQYVTYVVKDEYKQSLGEPFLIQQGDKYASTSDGTTITKTDVPSPGGMSQYIITNVANLTVDGSKNGDLWYLNPNADIDIEMGYYDGDKFPSGNAHNWTNDYSTTDFSASGFDPYNIQISSVPNNTKYFLSDATSGELSEGAWDGDGSSISLGEISTKFTATGHDSRWMPITDATFMAVQDESGNMMLMPRFDHAKRVMDFETLVGPNDPNIADAYTKLYRPLVYNYHIIDNDGNESLRYKSGGDLVPQTPEWFKSQLAKDFKYYKTLTSTGTNTYDLETLADEITEESSFAGAGLTTAGNAGNDVYVRYSYNEDADYNHVLQGKWLTMTLNNKDAQYTTVSETLGIYSGTKPATVNASAKTWQWKLLATPQSAPDPYAVSLYNRSQNGTATTVSSKTKFALLNWYDGSSIDPTAYTLAVAGTGDDPYTFVSGADMNTTTAATTVEEANFKGTSCTYTSGVKVEFTDDVDHTYTYKIYTNGTNGSNAVKYGVFAVSADQSKGIAEDNYFVPVLPEEIQSPLLQIDQYLYYAAEADMGAADKELTNLYGLYEDNVYVRYTAYDLLKSNYKVPNVKTTVDSKVARDAASNDAALDISGELIYNIIWYNDNMMRSTDNSTITGLANQDLNGADAYVWKFEGNDPYAIKIKHKTANKYAVGSDALDASATSTFMLLPAEDGWQYGMLQVTGGTNKLSGYGQTTVASDPTKFIIFGLSTNKVIYHLVIVKSCSNQASPATGEYVDIPYRATKGGSETTTRIYGSTKRDLTSENIGAGTHYAGEKYQLGSTINGVNYCVDYGNITLGDSLLVPAALKRPNCKYFFYIEGVYTDPDCDRSEPTHIHDLDDKYRGLQVTRMGSEPALVGATVRINIVYAFDDGLPTNNGSNFVTNANGTQWYTFETSNENLAHYTYIAGKLTGVQGREGHYTNDFLWSPVGDPYGFEMYNRYVYKNGGHSDYVMTTSSDPAADADLVMAAPVSNRPVYELLSGATPGYFKVQSLTVPGSGTPYYIDNTSGTITLQPSTTTEWTFGLSDFLFEPYLNGAGCVGGLDTTKIAVADFNAANLMEKQALVYNDANIVQFTPGYYRLSNEPGSSGITTPRYLSGYTHLTELTPGIGTNLSPVAIPMHFYERTGVNTTYEVLESGFTSTPATRGVIPITGPEYDPASIFYITGRLDSATMQTQGLYVKGAAMTDDDDEATAFIIDDLGGAVVTLRDATNRATASYLNYGQGSNIYDAKFTANIGIADETKWTMEPANKKGLYVETHSGGEEATLSTLWYYATLCVPFDLMVSNKDDDPDHSSNAYTCVSSESEWDGEMLHPRPIGKYTNAAGNSANYDESLRRRTTIKNGENVVENNDYFVPAGTPVIFSTKRATSYVKATIPTTTPSTSISTIFSAKYLEQLLPGWGAGWNAALAADIEAVGPELVYVFGPKMEGIIQFDDSKSDGSISAVLPSLGNTNVGFHVNANPNKELGMARASWTRNNYYVLHNKIYYHASGSAVGKPPYVPVVFDDEDGEQPDETQPDDQSPIPHTGAYDLMGRKVATEAEIKAGTWYQRLNPGIYIVDGRKVCIH